MEEITIPFERELINVVKRNPAQMTKDEFAQAASDIYQRLEEGDRLHKLEDGRIQSITWQDYKDDGHERDESLMVETVERITDWLNQIPEQSDRFDDAIGLLVDIYEYTSDPYRTMYLNQEILKMAWAMADRTVMSDHTLEWICRALVESEISQSGREGDRSHMNEIFSVIQTPENQQKLMDRAAGIFLPALERRLHRELYHQEIFMMEEDRVDVPVYSEMYFHMAFRLGKLDEVLSLPIYESTLEPGEWNGLVLTHVCDRMIEFGTPEDLNTMVHWAMQKGIGFLPINGMVNFQYLHCVPETGLFEIEYYDYSPAYMRGRAWLNPQWISLYQKIRAVGQEEYEELYGGSPTENPNPQDSEWLSPAILNEKSLKAGFYAVTSWMSPTLEQYINSDQIIILDRLETASVFLKRWMALLQSISPDSEWFVLSMDLQGLIFQMLHMGSYKHYDTGGFGFLQAVREPMETFEKILRFILQKSPDHHALELLCEMAVFAHPVALEDEYEYIPIEQLPPMRLVQSLSSEHLKDLYEIVKEKLAGLTPGEMWKPNLELNCFILRARADALLTLLLEAGLAIYPVDQVLDDFSQFTSLDLRKANQGNMVPEQVQVDEILRTLHLEDKLPEAAQYYARQGIEADELDKAAVRKRMLEGDEISRSESSFDEWLASMIRQRFMNSGMPGGSFGNPGGGQGLEDESSERKSDETQRAAAKKKKAKTKDKKKAARKAKAKNRKK